MIAEAFSCAPAYDPPTGTELRLRTPAGVRRINARADERLVAVAGAPRMLAVATQGANAQGRVRIELLDPRTGASRSTFAAPRAPGVNGLAVESDGVTVFCGSDRKLARGWSAGSSGRPPRC